jgi:hypothetical protein
VAGRGRITRVGLVPRITEAFYIVDYYPGAPMRESPKYERTRLHLDSYEKWFSTQRAKITRSRHGKQVVQDSYEAWIAKLVEKRNKKGPRAT